VNDSRSAILGSFCSSQAINNIGHFLTDCLEHILAYLIDVGLA